MQRYVLSVKMPLILDINQWNVCDNTNFLPSNHHFSLLFSYLCIVI